MLSLVYMPERKTSFRWPYGIGNVLTLFPSSKQFGLPRPPRGSPPPLFNKQKAPLTARDAARGGLRDGFSPTNWYAQFWRAEYAEKVQFAAGSFCETASQWNDKRGTAPMVWFPAHLSNSFFQTEGTGEIYSGLLQCKGRTGDRIGRVTALWREEHGGRCC